MDFVSRFFKKIWALGKGLVFTLGLFVILSAVLFLFRAGPRVQQPLKLEQNYFLELNLSGRLSESAVHLSPIDLMMGTLGPRSQEHYVPQIQNLLLKAVADDQIKGLLIKVSHLSGSWALFNELREALKQFKESGKTVLFWAEGLDTKQLLLASVANKIILAPAANLDIPGPQFQLFYYREALDKLGIDFRVYQTGRFKSLFEGAKLQKPSKAVWDNNQKLKNDMMEILVNKVSEGRGIIDRSQVATWFKESLFTSTRALERGIVDSLAYYSEVKKPLENDKIEFYPFRHYKNLQKKEWNPVSKDGIAFIEAVGEIRDQGQPNHITAEPFLKEIKWAREQKEVKGVLLRIGSPGGSPLAADLIWHELTQLAKEKPLVVSIGGVAASGGYYLLAPAVKVFADPLSITGSIGVVAMFPKAKELAAKLGISQFIVSDSDRQKYYDITSFESKTDRALIHQMLEDTYSRFIKVVAEGRGMQEEKVRSLAEGRVYVGKTALENGLVDQMGGLLAAKKELIKLSGLPLDSEPPVYLWKPTIESIKDCFRDSRSFEACFAGLSAKLAMHSKFDLEQQLSQMVPALSFLREGIKSKVLILDPTYLSID